MKITLQQVDHVARLARLELSDEDRMKFTKQLNDILVYIEKLNELDTSEVEPTSHVLPILNVFRHDQISSSLEIEESLANAPKKEGLFFQIPKIIE
ncbi:MAG: Asp-tRNA(Asn)/Glu-tRNA(Gln) amidotransferase subunit GatC [Candidatus Tectomicrobia bacterium]|uniref:Aspartyl/glutamyl-tRNA(Asn/Gln) amidotransferase subunit C n=1 Tax=Tectimicrobiota bacterium TaxID=2528274 RepID=A0A933GM67_UNCTE|nr:Asp-tRNA(Asn)/Glu-tRNA(Gln) amidotransferase subunit GatC [Candidatus Tectomicrobia bacterium]